MYITQWSKIIFSPQYDSTYSAPPVFIILQCLKKIELRKYKCLTCIERAMSEQFHKLVRFKVMNTKLLNTNFEESITFSTILIRGFFFTLKE